MLPLLLMTGPEAARAVAERAKELRLARNLTQQALAHRAGMSLSSLRRFERTGEVSFVALVNVAIALGVSDGLDGLFPRRPQSIDELLDKPKRKRGRRS